MIGCNKLFEPRRLNRGMVECGKKYTFGTFYCEDCSCHILDLALKEFSEIKCNYIKCAAGMGVAGNLKCYLRGDYTNKDCDKFVDEEEELERQSNEEE